VGARPVTQFSGGHTGPPLHGILAISVPGLHNDSMSEALSEGQKQVLLQLARSALEAHYRGEEPPSYAGDEPIMSEVRGVFATLHEAGQLRGCIGQVEPEETLADLVPAMAVAAATRDPRFHPVKAEELSALHLELSILTPARGISDLNEIEVGTHGLVISRGERRGLLLPQVPAQWNWSREDFLQNACLKAGLPAEAYKDPETLIEVFAAEVFGE